MGIERGARSTILPGVNFRSKARGLPYRLDRSVWARAKRARPPRHVRIHTAGTDPVLDLDRVWKAEVSIIPWLQRHLDLEGARVVEYGCGDGQVSRSLAPYVGSVLGLDIDRDMVELGRRKVEEAQIGNVDLQVHPLEDILDVFRSLKGKVDLVLLYAVLEHLTVAERLDVLHASRELAEPDGLIVVVESPNRLISLDSHSSHLPYLNWLPDEVARLYADRSPRQDYREGLLAARERGSADEAEWWVRFGRGVSFHEFELVFGDLSSHLLAGDYETVLWPGRPLQPEELPLSADLGRQRPDLAPIWSRHWLDFILSPVPLINKPRFVRPWPMGTENCTAVEYASWGGLRLRGRRSRLFVNPDRPTRRLVAGFTCLPGEAVLTVESGGYPVAEVRTMSTSEHMRYIDVAWEGDVDNLVLRTSTDTWLRLVAPEG